MNAETSAGDEIDPRRVRSRTRLLDAATGLLATGGIEAVTIDAVTKVSKVARATLYRHFSSSHHLLAATFERLIPQVTPPASAGSLRDQLIELLSRQAALIEDAPIQLTTLAWLSLGPANSDQREVPHSGDDHHPVDSLRARVIEQYRAPFDQLLASREARTVFGDLDPTLAITQLVGPIVFARLTGLRSFDHVDCKHLVDDFIAARWSGSR